MYKLSDKTTIYLSPVVKKYLQHKAVEEDLSVSELVNTHFAEQLEELQDKTDVKKRQGDENISFDQMLDELGLTYADLRD